MSSKPFSLWLPEAFRNPDTSVYIQGVGGTTYNGLLPEGFKIIALPRAWYLLFQGEPFEENDCAEAIVSLEKAMASDDSKRKSFSLNEGNSRIQLEPIGT